MATVKPGAGRRAAIVLGALAGSTLYTWWLFGLMRAMTMGDDYVSCHGNNCLFVNGQWTTLEDAWVWPLLFTAFGLGITGLVVMAIRQGALAIYRYIKGIPREPAYRCQRGKDCPCVDHQDRIRVEEELALAASAAAAGAAVASAASTINQ